MNKEYQWKIFKKKGRSLSYKTFLLWCLISIYQGAAIIYGSLILFEQDFNHIVAITFTALILTELLMVGLTVRTWHILMVISMMISLICYVASLVVLKEFFGTSYFYIFGNEFIHLFFCFFLFCLFRYWVYSIDRVHLESNHNNTGILFTIVYCQVYTYQVFTAKLCQADAVTRKMSCISYSLLTTTTKCYIFSFLLIFYYLFK